MNTKSVKKNYDRTNHSLLALAELNKIAFYAMYTSENHQTLTAQNIETIKKSAHMSLAVRDFVSQQAADNPNGLTLADVMWMSKDSKTTEVLINNIQIFASDEPGFELDLAIQNIRHHCQKCSAAFREGYWHLIQKRDPWNASRTLHPQSKDLEFNQAYAEVVKLRHDHYLGPMKSYLALLLDDNAEQSPWSGDPENVSDRDLNELVVHGSGFRTSSNVVDFPVVTRD